MTFKAKGCNITNMEKHETIKLWVGTKKMIKRICAETGETMVKMVMRLVENEWDRLQVDKKIQAE